MDGIYVGKRLLWTVIAFYLVLSAMFLLFVWAPDPNKERVQFTDSPDKEAVDQYLKTRNYDDPLADRWIDWVAGYTTGNLGISVTNDIGASASYGRPIAGLLVSRGAVTLVYLLPAVILSTVLGTGLGVYAALREGTLADRVVTALAYAPVGIPEFVLAELSVLVAIDWLSLTTRYHPARGLFTAGNLVSLTLPLGVVALNLLAVQFRYARAESLEVASAEFVRLLRARGAPLRDLARHVLRNAAPVLLSLFFVETLSVLFFTVFVVELVFKVPGIGQLGWFAIQNRDIRTFGAVTMVPVVVGLLGTLVQDVGYAVLDPRVDSE